MYLHNNPGAVIALGNTLVHPHFKDGSALKTFDVVVANPPFSDKSWSTGLDPENVLEGLATVLAQRDDRGDVHPVVPEDYAIDNCSQRAVNFILSTHRRHEQWSGLRPRA